MSTSVGPIVTVGVRRRWHRRTPLAIVLAALVLVGDRLAAPPRARSRFGGAVRRRPRRPVERRLAELRAARRSPGVLGEQQPRPARRRHARHPRRAGDAVGQRRARRRDGRGSHLRRHQRRSRLVLGPQRSRRARPPVAEPEPCRARSAGPDRRRGDRRGAAARAARCSRAAWSAAGAPTRAASSAVRPRAGRRRRRRWRACRRSQRIFAGGSNTCATAADGRLLCWGADDSGQLGDDGTDARPTPAPVPGADGMVSVTIANNTQAGKKVPDISNSAGFICGVRGSDGRVLCWGNNYTGQLGDGSRDEPRAADAGAGNRRRHPGGGRRPARLRAAPLGPRLVLGRNEFGAIGDGTMGPRLDPPRPRRRAFDRGRGRHLGRRRAQLRAPPARRRAVLGREQPQPARRRLERAAPGAVSGHRVALDRAGQRPRNSNPRTPPARGAERDSHLVGRERDAQDLSARVPALRLRERPRGGACPGDDGALPVAADDAVVADPDDAADRVRRGPTSSAAGCRSPASQIRTPLPAALVLAICLPSGENVASAISSAIPFSVRARVPAGMFQTVARWSTPPAINCAPDGEK